MLGERVFRPDLFASYRKDPSFEEKFSILLLMKVKGKLPQRIRSTMDDKISSEVRNKVKKEISYAR